MNVSLYAAALVTFAVAHLALDFLLGPSLLLSLVVMAVVLGVQLMTRRGARNPSSDQVSGARLTPDGRRLAVGRTVSDQLITLMFVGLSWGIFTFLGQPLQFVGPRLTYPSGDASAETAALVIGAALLAGFCVAGLWFRFAQGRLAFELNRLAADPAWTNATFSQNHLRSSAAQSALPREGAVVGDPTVWVPADRWPPQALALSAFILMIFLVALRACGFDPRVYLEALELQPVGMFGFAPFQVYTAGIAFPILFTVVILSQRYARLGIGPGGIRYDSWLRKLEVPWEALRPSARAKPSGNWGSFSFGYSWFGDPRVFSATRDQARAILSHPNAPRDRFPPEYWAWLGLAPPTASL